MVDDAALPKVSLRVWHVRELRVDFASHCATALASDLAFDFASDFASDITPSLHSRPDCTSIHSLVHIHPARRTKMFV